MQLIRKFIFIYILLKIYSRKNNLIYSDLNFKKLDFTNYKQIKSFIFKKNFYKLQNKNVQSFDFLNFSKNLGGKIGINYSKKSIFDWNKVNKGKFNYPWTEDLSSRRLINLLYNYEFINSSSTKQETYLLNKIILNHVHRVIYDFNSKKIYSITSYDLVAYLLSRLILNRFSEKDSKYLDFIIISQIDKLGMHKSYNILEHVKYVNNLSEIKNILLFFKVNISKNIEDTYIKMTSILNEYFHDDGSIPLFNGSNNNYTKTIHDSINREEYLKSRKYEDNVNGIAFYKDKNKKIFFDVVQPNKDKISNNLNAGTLSFEFSSFGEKIITNCGASESFGKNPEYLRYSAAHSTIILQNTNISEIKENNPHIKFPQSVKFNLFSKNNSTIFEGSHNGYARKFKKIVKRTLFIDNDNNKIRGEDAIISLQNNNDRVIYHIRFHLVDGISYNFTNSKKNVILRTKSKNIWIFKSDVELVIEDSIYVDNNKTIPTKQIVIKGVINNIKQTRKWSFEKQ